MGALGHECQRDALDALLFKHGYGKPWEIKVREIAREAVADPRTFAGGTHWPVRLRRARGVGKFYPNDTLSPPGPSRYGDVRVSLIPELQDHPDVALLIAEEIIREQTVDHAS